jgi:hypothetical protein
VERNRPRPALTSPFPDPLSAVLDLLVRHLVDAIRHCEVALEDAVRLAVVSGWYEGHIEGEDTCPGSPDDVCDGGRLAAVFLPTNPYPLRRALVQTDGR